MKGLMMDYQLTTPTLLRRAESLFGNKEIVTCLPNKEIHRYTYKDLAHRSKKLAVALRELGIQKGDRVATLCWNHYQHLEAYFAIPGMGAVLHTLNLRLSAADLTYIVDHAEDKVIIVDQVLLPLFEKIKPSVKLSAVIVISQTGEPLPKGYLDYETFISNAEASLFEPFEEDEYAAACLCYTSGTTGYPKGVLYSHRSIVLHSMAFLLACTGRGIQERDVVLPIVPMFHACAWGFPFSCTFAGATQVFPGPHLDAPNLLRLFEQERVTLTGGVPTVIRNILNEFEQSGSGRIFFLSTIIAGGSAIPKNLIKEFDEKFGITVLHTWGMTELSPLGTTMPITSALAHLPKEEQYDHAIRQGLPVPFVEARGRNEDGFIPYDGKTMGELEVRGPWVAGGYYKDNTSSQKFTEDGWFKTGDIVTIHPDGSIEINDRSKDLIKSGGEWISSVALENALMCHPSIQEACVIAIPDDKWMERPYAYIVVKQNNAVSIEELKEFLAGKFARFWIPEGYEQIEAIPKTSVGKFQKTALREKYSKEH